MGFTKYATDMISEKIGLITACGATNVSDEFASSTTWLSSFGLCVIFQDQPPPHHRSFSLQFVRRVEMSFAEYASAVAFLRNFVNGNSASLSTYFRALHHFEAAISQLYLAYDASRKMLSKDYFVTGDGSGFERLNRLYNDSKHVAAAADQPLWISNDGIHSERASVLFSEIEQLLRSYASIANRLTNQEAQ